MNRLIFDHYEVQYNSDNEPVALGRGSMGHTYLARNSHNGQSAVVKVIYPGDRSRLPRGVEAFRKTVPDLIEINHPNLARVLYLGDYRHGFFFAMEYCKGKSLFQIIQESGPLAPDRVFLIASQIAKGLCALDGGGLSHCDIKPQNIMVSGDPTSGPLECKLIDFGPAEHWSPADADALGPPTVLWKKGYLGTVHFISPELAAGKPAGHGSDVYSLGATIWYALCGRPPYEGHREDIIEHHQNKDLNESQLPPLSQTARSLLLRMMSDTPDERPGGTELAIALEKESFRQPLLTPDTLRNVRLNTWKNSLAMVFLPCPGLEPSYAGISPVRVADFAIFVHETGHDASRDVISIEKDGLLIRGHTWRQPGFQQEDDHPVVGVNRHDAEAFCQWLTARERRMEVLTDDQFYRLPTDREWSLLVGVANEDGDTPAARHENASKETFPWGLGWPPPAGSGNYAGVEKKNEAWPPHRAIISELHSPWPRTSSVRAFAANENGFHDLGGNVWEWCRDAWGRKGNEENHGVLRGASWYDASPDLLMSLGRYHHPARLRCTTFGFRCVLDLGEKASG